MFDDTEHNGEEKVDNRTNNDLQNITENNANPT
jgi:hypothetical protein